LLAGRNGGGPKVPRPGLPWPGDTFDADLQNWPRPATRDLYAQRKHDRQADAVRFM
jgi:hypothetical protein